jgi:hypothetical protein
MSQTEKPVGRNDPCPCGSGRKYKQCCLEKDAEALRKTRAKEAKKAAKAKPKEAEDAGKQDETRSGAPRDSRSAPHSPSGPRGDQPWKRGAGNAHPGQRRSMHRKIGSK